MDCSAHKRRRRRRRMRRRRRRRLEHRIFGDYFDFRIFHSFMAFPPYF
jgi:hypothetical protein